MKSKDLRKIFAEVYDWAEGFLIALLIFVILQTFAVRTTRVDGTSMVPTLEDGQYLTIQRHFYTLQHNDIIVLHAPRLENDTHDGYGKTIIKRVVGLPGDTIDIDFLAGIVYRNGEALPLSADGMDIHEDGHSINEYTHLKRDTDFPVTVPEGCVFVMGDNRNISVDSRDSRVGILDDRFVVGKVTMRLLPFDKIGAIK